MGRSDQPTVGNGTHGFQGRPGMQNRLNTQPLQVTMPIPGQPPVLPVSPTPPKRRLVPIFLISFVLLIVSILVLVGMNLSSLLPVAPPTGAAQASGQGISASNSVGHLFFLSSGQVNEQTSQGIADEVQLDLSHITPPASGNSYYAWLLGDNPAESSTVLLGKLVINHGNVHLVYTGDAQHTNLLTFASRFLITEEPAAPTPAVPSLDPRAWRYSAAFPRTPNPLDTVHHFGLLDHLRHLLASDPTMQLLHLPGGLDIWLFRDTQKILEWAGSARDDQSAQSTDLMHRQFVRILDYLDGLNYVQNDVPLDTPALVDPQIGRAGLLEFDPQNQEPPGLLYHIGTHLRGLVQSPGASAAQKQLAITIDDAINRVQAWLEQVHQDAKKLVVMDGAQLLQPSALSLLDDMVTNAQYAFTGQFDPTTNNLQFGVTQIHYAIGQLATMDITVGSSGVGRISTMGQGQG